MLSNVMSKYPDSVSFVYTKVAACLYSKRNSLTIGDPLNSGLSRMQLKKYCSPTLRCSKNFGLYLDIRLFGGRGGIAASELGNVWSSLCRRSSNSEYRFRIRKEEPLSVSTVIFHTTNAPILVLRSFTTTWSSIYTLLAQQALFLSSLTPSVLSCKVIAPASTDSTDMFETDLWCEDTQYGGLVTGEEIGVLTPFFRLSAGDVFVSSPGFGAPVTSPLVPPWLDCVFRIDSIHLPKAAINRRRECGPRCYGSKLLWKLDASCRVS